MSTKLVLITGAYGNLGMEFALTFKKNGYRVIITGRNETKLNSAGKKLGCETFPLDVLNEDQVIGLRDYIKNNHQKLDVLINNAGVMRSGPVEEMDPALFLNVIQTNIYGPFLLTHHLISLLKKSSHALILNIASTSGHRADPGSSAYNASKFGLLGFTESVRKELRRDNIRVTSISPSEIQFGEGPSGGKGARLGGKDIAEMAVYIANSPTRAMVRDVEMWATNP